MTHCVVMECPACGRLNRCPAERASTDVLADRISDHVVRHHPEVPAAESEEIVTGAVDGAEVAETDLDPEDLGGWTEP